MSPDRARPLEATLLASAKGGDRHAFLAVTISILAVIVSHQDGDSFAWNLP
jgi:hypothetical protein